MTDVASSWLQPSSLQQAADLAEDAATLLRLTRDLPRLLRTPLPPKLARERVQRRLAQREHNLLSLLERAVYGNPRSPYLGLLRLAGCEMGDLRHLITQEGIEGGLRILADRGVYVTYDEMKGRQPAVRGSQRLTFAAADFDNPLARPHFVVQTSGSGGRPVRIRYPLSFIDAWAADMALLFQAHGLDRPRHAFWWPVPLAWLLVCARLRQPVLGWFYPVQPLPRLARWGAQYISLLGRVAGQRFPTPQRCDLHQPEQMLTWVREQLAGPPRERQPLMLWTSPSSAVRLAAAAVARGQSLDGLTVHILGEPATAARRRQIEEAGAKVIVGYTLAEAGGLSYSCATPDAPDDVHLFTDRYSMVTRLRPVIPGGPEVDALMVTSLTRHVARITLNAETGDTGHLQVRACGCQLGEVRLDTHLSHLMSFEKLTGEGVTFARSNLSRILEEQLPASFGGTPLDYQLAEDVLPDGLTRLVLRVSPSVGPVDEADLGRALLALLGGDALATKYQASVWSHAGTLEIRREAPQATRGGKVLPFSAARSGTGRGQGAG